jgi:uncharacterized membrane protein (DUF2068 family)
VGAAGSEDGDTTTVQPWTPERAHAWYRVHAETLTCALRGHVLPAATVARLRPEDAGLGVELRDGRRLCRCTRCDVWVEIDPPARPGREVLPPLDRLPLPRRGKALRDAIVIRIIALDRALHSLLFGLIAVALLLLELRLGWIRTAAAGLLRDLSAAAANTGQDPSRTFVVRELHRVLGLRQHTVLVLLAISIGYCLIEGVEAVGLWLERRWAEYLAAVATAGFLPFEIRELVEQVTVLRVIALVVNLAILVWLVWRKRLFGIRGGLEAERAEEVDREALFGPPRPDVAEPPAPTGRAGPPAARAGPPAPVARAGPPAPAGRGMEAE